MLVRFSIAEFDYLSTSVFLGQALKSVLMKATLSGQSYVAELSAEEAEALRDASGEQLQRAGFDHDYNATKEGTILESLIDKLFVL